MELDGQLAARRDAILGRWFDAILASYPPDTAQFLTSVADPFANPVGSTLREGLARLLDAVAAGAADARLARELDGIVRIRAVQEFAPSAAVAFVFELKAILREELGDAAGAAEWAGLERAVDRLALAAFDVYMQCREKIFEIRVREIRETQLLAARTRT